MEFASGSHPGRPPEEGDLSCLDVTASYRRGLGRRPALRGVTLTARAGAVTAVVGPNGAGKTTLFRVLLGFLDADAGQVRIQGEPPRKFRRHRGVPYVPDSEGLPRGWTVDGLLRRGLRLAGRPIRAPEEARSAVDDARRRAGLEGRGAAPLETLSRGQARRLVLSYALLADPSVVLLDEPLAGLDPPARGALEARILALRGGRATVLLASHDLEAVARLADRIVVLAHGRVIRALDAAARGSDTVEALRDAFREIEASS